MYVAGGACVGSQRAANHQRRLFVATAVHQRALSCSARSPASNSACAMCTQPTHWAIEGTPPAYDTPDEDVYLHGRNVGRCSRKTAVYAAIRPHFPHRHRTAGRQSVSRCHPRSFSRRSTELSRSVWPLTNEVLTPFAHLHKEDVVKLGAGLGVPFELTLSCMNPSDRPDAFRTMQQVPRTSR